MVHSESSKMAAVIFLLSKLFVECSVFWGWYIKTKSKQETELLLPGDEGKPAVPFVMSHAPNRRKFMGSSVIQGPHWWHQGLASSPALPLRCWNQIEIYLLRRLHGPYSFSHHLRTLSFSHLPLLFIFLLLHVEEIEIPNSFHAFNKLLILSASLPPGTRFRRRSACLCQSFLKYELADAWLLFLGFGNCLQPLAREPRLWVCVCSGDQFPLRLSQGIAGGVSAYLSSECVGWVTPSMATV